MKRLLSLEEFNTKQREQYFDQTKPHPNGIECPKCGKELWDSNPMVELTSYPPKKISIAYIVISKDIE